MEMQPPHPDWEKLNRLYDEMMAEAKNDPWRLPFNQDKLEVYERLEAEHPEWGIKIVRWK